jgi:hypothetical protein
MSLLTSTLLQQLKETFGLRMTWTLGVLTLAFRVEDGFYELHRRVPYDYDSEFQDKYQKVAVALMDGWSASLPCSPSTAGPQPPNYLVLVKSS